MKIVASNRRARHDYAITKKLVTGLVLSGAEVKSVKTGNISLKGSFVHHRAGELYLVNAHITPYKFGGAEQAEPTRERKLLAHRREIDDLINGSATQGMSVIPLAVGIERGLVKLEIGVGRGKRQYDKRESLQKQAQERDIARDIKQK